MPRLTLNLAAALILAAAPVAAETPGARLEGTWMAIGDMLGLLPGHIEVLTIDGRQARSVTWRLPEGDCAARPDAAACALPLPTASGAFSGNSFQIGVTPDAANASPFAGTPEAPLWPLLALDGAPWSMFRQGGRLMTSRPATIRGSEVPMLRLWLRVEPDLPEHLFDYLAGFGLDIARAVCPVATLHEDPAAWAVFRDTLAEAAPALHAHRLASEGRVAEAPDNAAFARLDHLAAGTGDLPAGAVLLPGLPWPATPAAAQAALRCLTSVFGG